MKKPLFLKTESAFIFNAMLHAPPCWSSMASGAERARSCNNVLDSSAGLHSLTARTAAPAAPQTAPLKSC